MTNPVLLHLTDTHFPAEVTPEGRRHQTIFSALVSFLTDLPEGEWRPTHVCITGDLTSKGDAGGYKHAVGQLATILEALEIPRQRVFICPGNHDVQRDRAKLLNFPATDGDYRVRPTNATEADAWLTLDTGAFRPSFQNYESFCEAFGVPPSYLEGAPSHLVGERTDADSKLRFITLNSAWFCRGSDDHGKLWLGWQHLQALLPRLDDVVERVIVLIHHPRDWYHQDETSAARLSEGGRRANPFDYLAKRSHLILTGHTHGEIRDADRIAMGAYHLTGGATGESVAHFNTVRLVRVEPDGFRYRSLEYRPEQAEPMWIGLPREKFLPLIHIDPSHEQGRDAWLIGLKTFRDWPFDPSAPFHHVFDWSADFNHSPLVLPSAEQWQRYVDELIQKKSELQTGTRLAKLTPGPQGRTGGSLSAGFAFGHVFQGFDLHIEQDFPGGATRQVWRTDVKDIEATPPNDLLRVEKQPCNEVSNHAALLVSVTQSVTPSFERYRAQHNLDIATRLECVWGGEVLLEEDALHVTRRIAKEVRRTLSAQGATDIHIFYAGPFALAVMLGQALNRVGRLHFYEYSGSGYVHALQLDS